VTKNGAAAAKKKVESSDESSSDDSSDEVTKCFGLVKILNLTLYFIYLISAYL